MFFELSKTVHSCFLSFSSMQKILILIFFELCELFKKVINICLLSFFSSQKTQFTLFELFKLAEKFNSCCLSKLAKKLHSFLSFLSLQKNEILSIFFNLFLDGKKSNPFFLSFFRLQKSNQCFLSS